MPLVYIIILNYNNWLDTIECLDSLKRINYSRFKVIVIDNKSIDNSFEKLYDYLHNQSYNDCEKKWKFNLYDEIEFLQNKKFSSDIDLFFVQAKCNRGYAYGNNIGLKGALKDPEFMFAWVLNNDTTTDKNSLASLVNYFQLKIGNGVKLGLLGSKLIFYHEPDTIQCIGGHYRALFGFPKQIGLGSKVNSLNSIDDTKIDYVSGASVFVSAEFIKDVGLMSEDYFLYFEELDWAKRGKLKNYTLGYCNESIVYHKDGASTKVEKKKILSSPFSDFYFTKSKIIFTRKFYKNRLLPIYFSFLLVIINRIRKKQFKSIVAILRAIIGLKYV